MGARNHTRKAEAALTQPRPQWLVFPHRKWLCLVQGAEGNSSPTEYQAWYDRGCEEKAKEPTTAELGDAGGARKRPATRQARGSGASRKQGVSSAPPGAAPD